MNRQLDDIVAKIMQTASAAMPDSLAQGAKENLRAVVKNILRDMDVVTREEFEVQQAVLAKTRAKLHELEKTIERLEEASS